VCSPHKHAQVHTNTGAYTHIHLCEYYTDARTHRDRVGMNSSEAGLRSNRCSKLLQKQRTLARTASQLHRIHSSAFHKPFKTSRSHTHMCAKRHANMHTPIALLSKKHTCSPKPFSPSKPFCQKSTPVALISPVALLSPSVKQAHL
jgi:hypothetical protein